MYREEASSKCVLFPSAVERAGGSVPCAGGGERQEQAAGCPHRRPAAATEPRGESQAGGEAGMRLEVKPACSMGTSNHLHHPHSLPHFSICH